MDDYGDDNYWNPMQEYLLGNHKRKPTDGVKENEQATSSAKSNRSKQRETVASAHNSDPRSAASGHSIPRNDRRHENTPVSNVKTDSPKHSSGKASGRSTGGRLVTNSGSRHSSSKKVFGNVSGDTDPKWHQYDQNAPTPVKDNYVKESEKGDTGPPQSVADAAASSVMGRINRIEDENEQLLADNKRLIESLRKLDTDTTQFNERVKYAEDTMQKTMTENERLKSENEDLTRQIHKLKEDNDKLRKSSSDSSSALQSRLNDFESERETIEKRMNDANESIQYLTKEVETLTEMKNQLESQLLDVSSDRMTAENQLDSQVAGYESQLNELREQNEQTKIDLEETEKENEKLLENLEKIRAENDRIAAQNLENEDVVDGLRRQLDQERDRFKEADQERTQLMRELSDVKGRLDDLQKSSSSRSEDMKLEKGKLEDDLSEMQNRLKSYKELEAELQKKLRDRNREIADLESELGKVKERLERKEKEECKKCETYKKEIRRQERKITDLKECVETLRLSGTSVSDLSKQKQEYIEELQREVVELRKTNLNQLEEVAKLKGNNITREVVDIQLDEIKGSHKRLIEENRRLKASVAQKNMEDTNKKSEMKNVTAKYEDALVRLNKAQTRITKLEAMLDDIYDNEEFQNFIKRDDDSTRQSVTLLPDIAISNTPRYSTTPRTWRKSEVSTARLEEQYTQRKRKR